MNFDYITLDKYSKIPLYDQLKSSILSALSSGRLKAGDKLPTEEEICQTFHVSRIVAKQAYTDLLKEGRIIRERGKGTFVRKPDNRGLFMQNMYSFHEEMRLLEKKPSSILVISEVITYQPDIYTELGLSEKDTCLHLERMRFADGEPFNYTVNYVPLNLFPGLEKHDFSKESLYHILRTEYHSTPVRAKRSIQAAKANTSIAEHLGIETDSAILILKSLSYDQNNRLVDLSIESMSALSHQFDFEVSL